MTTKTACGSCGKSGGCGCSTPNPYAESARVVWHDPIDYDAMKHGPSYFPGMKLSSAQKRSVRAFVKTQNVAPAWVQALNRLPPSDRGSLLAPTLLGALRGAALVHQTHHWMTHGPSFFGDHQLFQRLYEDSQEGIDLWAERIVATFGTSINHVHQAEVMKLSAQVCGADSATTPDEMIKASLQVETVLLVLLGRMKKDLESADLLSAGVSNLLDGLSDKHETFVYLLQQRAGSYEYDRR